MQYETSTHGTVLRAGGVAMREAWERLIVGPPGSLAGQHHVRRQIANLTTQERHRGARRDFRPNFLSSRPMAVGSRHRPRLQHHHEHSFVLEEPVSRAEDTFGRIVPMDILFAVRKQCHVANHQPRAG